MIRRLLLVATAATTLTAASADAQIDTTLAHRYFAEAKTLCENEGGRTWGVSLCGPMVFADPVTRALVGSEPLPDAPRPAVLGYANAAVSWGGTKWSVYVWQMLPRNEKARANLLMHELFHRVQQELGLFLNEGPSNDHLDTVEGRWLLQLEWRALAAALAASGDARREAIADALAFRQARHARFPGTAETERVLEINEGLAQYTATVATNDTPREAEADAAAQLGIATSNETFVRTFPYPSGAAYGVLLDGYSPGWPRRMQPSDDLAALVGHASRATPAADVAAAAARHGGAELRAAEVERDRERQRRVAELRRRLVEGPVLVVPAGTTNSFVTTGLTPIPGAGTVYTSYRSTGQWGRLDGKLVLVSTDRATLTVPAPADASGRTVAGDGWTLELTDGWRLEPGPRAGDFRVTREPPH